MCWGLVTQNLNFHFFYFSTSRNIQWKDHVVGLLHFRWNSSFFTNPKPSEKSKKKSHLMFEHRSVKKWHHKNKMNECLHIQILHSQQLKKSIPINAFRVIYDYLHKHSMIYFLTSFGLFSVDGSLSLSLNLELYVLVWWENGFGLGCWEK